MNIAYVRVSSADQNEERQVENLKKYDIEKWFIEKASGKNTDRAKFKEMMEFCREGDSIYVHDLSRLSRSLPDLLKTVELCEEKGVTLISTKETLDTSTPTGRLMLSFLGAINQFERENLKERQREGINIAKKKGIYKGRKKAQIDKTLYEDLLVRYNKREINKTQMAKELGISRPTLDRMMKETEKI